MQRKINYIKVDSSQYVYEQPASSPEESDIFVSFREVDKSKFDLIKSCSLIANDLELSDMTQANTIYLDTVTNKRRKILKNQTKFLLAPILHKLKEQDIKYVLLYPSIMEAYFKEYSFERGLEEVGQEFKRVGYSNEALVEKLLEQRRNLARYYEKLGFKSYDPCPGFKPDDWQIIDNDSKTMMNFPLDITYENSFELIRYTHPDSKQRITLKIPSQYWMIAKVDDLYKILFTECIKERIIKFKELGVRVFSDVNEKIKSNIDLLESQIKLIKELNQQIDVIQLDNFNVEFPKLNHMINTNKTEIEQLKESMIDADFSKDLDDLIIFGQQLSSGTITMNGLVKCLNMAKEFEDRDIWILNGGSNSGFYINSAYTYKKLYLKYKTKYLHSKNN